MDSPVEGLLGKAITALTDKQAKVASPIWMVLVAVLMAGLGVYLTWLRRKAAKAQAAADLAIEDKRQIMVQYKLEQNWAQQAALSVKIRDAEEAQSKAEAQIQGLSQKQETAVAQIRKLQSWDDLKLKPPPSAP